MQSNSLNNKNIAISSRVVSALVLVFVELMFFSALISSYFVIRKGREIWNTAGAIPLPTLASGFNVFVLLLSGFFIFSAGKALRKKQDLVLAKAHFFRTITLGGFFLAFQLFLALRLMSQGLTMSSSVFGGCFYLVTGAHLLNVIPALFLMFKLYGKMGTEDSATLRDQFNSLQIFWFFIVIIWPVLYAEIYF